MFRDVITINDRLVDSYECIKALYHDFAVENNFPGDVFTILGVFPNQYFMINEKEHTIKLVNKNPDTGEETVLNACDDEDLYGTFISFFHLISYYSKRNQQCRYNTAGK